MDKVKISIKVKANIGDKKRYVHELSDEEFLAVVEKCTSIKEIAKHLGIVSTQAIRSRINRMGDMITAHFVGNKSYIESLTNEELAIKVQNSNSYYDLAMNIGYSNNIGGSILPHIRQYLESKGISTSHFGTNNVYKSGKTKLGWHKKQELLHKNKNTCSICGLSDLWNGLPIKMHVDHINGDSWDHREENLRLLCPNCHSQQDTTCSKNKSAVLFYKKRAFEASAKSVELEKCVCGESILSKGAGTCQKCYKLSCRKVQERPSLDVLLKELKISSYVQVGKRYGISDNAVRQWFKLAGFYPPLRKELNDDISIDELRKIEKTSI